jgi:hypothetical protein
MAVLSSSLPLHTPTITDTRHRHALHEEASLPLLLFSFTESVPCSSPNQSSSTCLSPVGYADPGQGVLSLGNQTGQGPESFNTLRQIFVRKLHAPGTALWSALYAGYMRRATEVWEISFEQS